MTFGRSLSRAAVLAALVVACVPTGGGAQAPPAIIRLGTVVADEITPILYAQHAGLYARAGLDVQITAVASGAAVTAAVLSGSYEIGKSSLPALMNAYLRGLPVAIIAPGGVYDPHAPYEELIVATESPIRGPRDLEGKTVGVPSLHDLNELAVDGWVEAAGGDYQTIKYVELPNSAAGVAVAEHRVDAANVSNPPLAAALRTGRVRVAGHPWDAIGPSFLISVWFTTKEWAASHPDQVRAFARTTEEAGAYTNTHHAETAPVVADYTKIPLSYFTGGMTRTVSGTTLRVDQIQPVIDLSAKYKFIPRSIPARELLAATSGHGA
jgi:NitT/TauT family transport system substrate-binding protein